MITAGYTVFSSNEVSTNGVSPVCKAMMKSGDRAQFEGLRHNRKLTVLQIGRSALESARDRDRRARLHANHPISCA